MNGFEVLGVNVIPVLIESGGSDKRKMQLSDLMNLDLSKLFVPNVQAVQQQQNLSVGKEAKEVVNEVNEEEVVVQVNETESIIKQHEANIIRALKYPPTDETWEKWYNYARLLIVELYYGVGVTSLTRHIKAEVIRRGYPEGAIASISDISRIHRWRNAYNETILEALFPKDIEAMRMKIIENGRKQAPYYKPSATLSNIPKVTKNEEAIFDESKLPELQEIIKPLADILNDKRDGSFETILKIQRNMKKPNGKELGLSQYIMDFQKQYESPRCPNVLHLVAKFPELEPMFIETVTQLVRNGGNDIWTVGNSKRGARYIGKK